jgi:hypothetical protein
MNRALPTVAVEMDGAQVVINESDFNADVHQLWIDEKTKIDTEKMADAEEVEAVRSKPGRKPKNS